MRVTLAARREPELATVAGQIAELGGQALVVPTDVSQQGQVQRLVDQTLAHWGRLDIVVANAGTMYRRPIAQMTADFMAESLAVNFYGAFYLVLAALPHLLAQRSGHIVLVSSMDAKKGVPPEAAYVTAKWAMAGFGDVLRQELYGTGVDVSILFPGRVDTPLIPNLKVPWISAKIPPEPVARAIIGAIQHRRAEVVLPAQALALVWVNALSPRLGDWAVRTFKLSG